MVLANAFTLAPPYFIGKGIDALDEPATALHHVLIYAGLVIASALLGGAARYGMRELLNGTSRRVEYDLGNDLFAHLTTLDASFYGRTPTGDIMSRMTNDLSAVRMAAGPAYMYLVNTTVGTLISLSLMLWISPWLTLVSMIPMVALPPVTVGFGRIINRRFERIQEQFSTLSTSAQENLSGMRIVKAYGRERQQAERFRELSEEYFERNMKLARVSGLFHPLLALISGFAIVVALLVGGRAVMRDAITVGDFVTFTLYLGQLTWPMIALGWVVNLFQRGAASMGRINGIFSIQPALEEAEVPAEPEGGVRGEVEFRHVSFRYPGTEREVLHDVSFRVPAGSMLAVVGATGSGKSTLAALLVRLYDPTEGEILLDGVPIREMSLERLRAAIGVVPQDAFLFSDTLRENLGLGFEEESPEAELARIRAAAGIAQLDETIQAFPAAYETRLGERGVNLSGGQKQRATLARAIARDPRVLVLDDALSAVDTHTEAEILAGLRGVLKDRTSIVISHRISAVMGADQVVVVADGQVVERGTHAELLQKGGTYAALLHRQILADEVAGDGALAPTRSEI
ncbi:MAG TPA: ABC transporter ATP-binding protein [Longimicrobiaceae bacterium]|nr:ABC transporter ATP-binding protein [Longimicrobiaceae bacterium]